VTELKKYSNSEVQMLKTEEKIMFNYELTQQVLCGNLRVLSQPSIMGLKIAERSCPGGHKIKVAKLFAVEEAECPTHKCEYEKSKSHYTIDAYEFYVENMKKDKLHIFMLPEEREKHKLDIYDRINIDGYKIETATSKNTTSKGLFCIRAEVYEESPSSQKSMLTKSDVIEQFGLDSPSLMMTTGMFEAYKHSLILSAIHKGINILVVGNPSLNKSRYAKLLKDLAGGIFVDSQTCSEAGMLGMAVRDYSSSGFHFEGGAIFQAKAGGLLTADELDKMFASTFLSKLNGITGNNYLKFDKGTCHFEDDQFFVSFVGFANPIHKWFQTNPKLQIEQTFRQNSEFLSRSHFIWALTCKVNSKTKRKYNIEQLKIYIKHAKQIKITEDDITPEAQEAMRILSDSNLADDRFDKKLQDLCIAEAKFSLHHKVLAEDVAEVAKLLEYQKASLHSR
jgi:hypothetical protein